MGLTFMGFTYLARGIYDTTTPKKGGGELAKDVIGGFLKLRAGFATISLLTEFWGAKLSLNKAADGSVYLTNNAKRMLLLKEAVINFLWWASISAEVHRQYKNNNAIDSSQPLPH
jgi:hypothetical protein